MSMVSLQPGLEQRNYERRIRDWRRLGKVVEAVGIEPSPEDLGLHDSGAIARKGADRKTSLKRSESGLTALLGTRVPGSDSIDAILAHARLAWGAMRVI
jgi:hypothetical protein